ncbi:MAG: N-acetylmuramic acid 6-phosphate etherase [Albidovulum sp.]
MSLPQTEMTPRMEHCIDAMSSADAAAALIAGQVAAASSVMGARAGIVEAAQLSAATLRSGGALNYVAAGSSGLMALSDGSELAGTFGIAQDQVRIFMAGGVPVDGIMPGDTEDDVSEAEGIVNSFGGADLVIALSASGTTAYPVAVARHARQKGIKVVAITNNPGTPLQAVADVAVVLETPPEVLAGSTRLGAGTAQKIALNSISTLAGVMLGHIHNGMMVNLKADNTKLRMRARAIVAKSAGVSGDAAERALQTAQGDTKLAVLLAAGCTIKTATQLLATHGGFLKPCLDAIGNDNGPQQ